MLEKQAWSIEALHHLEPTWLLLVGVAVVDTRPCKRSSDTLNGQSYFSEMTGTSKYEQGSLNSEK